MTTLVSIAYHYFVPIKVRSSGIYGVRTDQILHYDRFDTDVVSGFKKEYFINNFGQPVYLTFRNGTIMYLPPESASFRKDRSIEPALYYLVDMGGLRGAMLNTYSEDQTKQDAVDSERVNLRELLRLGAIRCGSKDSWSKDYENFRLLYVYKPYTENGNKKAIAIYWEDADVVISSQHPDASRVIHPHSHTMGNLASTKPRLYELNSAEPTGVISIEMKLVNVNETCLYIPVANQVVKIPMVEDPSMEPGLHITTDCDVFMDKFKNYQNQLGRYFIPPDQITNKNGFYRTYDEAEHIAKADLEMLIKTKSKLTNLEIDKERIAIRDHEFRLQQEKDKHETTLRIMQEQADARARIAEQEHKASRNEELHQKEMLYLERERQLKMEHMQAENSHKQKMQQLDNTVSTFKAVTSLLSLGLLTCGLIIKNMS